MKKSALEILQLGHPHLRRTSHVIPDPSDVEFQDFTARLVEFVSQQGGMGIAAPQVNVASRMFIMSSHPNSRYPTAPIMDATVVINPEITWTSPEIEKDWEGCLSLPGIRGLVSRHKKIKVSYLSASGEQIETEYTDFLARIFQHELDHLNGTVFLDRVDSTHEIMMEQEWQRRVIDNNEVD